MLFEKQKIRYKIFNNDHSAGIKFQIKMTGNARGLENIFRR